MINIGNDNVAVKLRDVEYVYESGVIQFSFEKGIYFFTVAFGSASNMQACTFIFDSAILEKLGTPGIANIGAAFSSDSPITAIKITDKIITIGMNASSGITSKDDVISFKYIPKE